MLPRPNGHPKHLELMHIFLSRLPYPNIYPNAGRGKGLRTGLGVWQHGARQTMAVGRSERRLPVCVVDISQVSIDMARARVDGA